MNSKELNKYKIHIKYKKYMRAQQCYYSSETMATCIVVDAVRYERFSKVICASSECMERFGILTLRTVSLSRLSTGCRAMRFRAMTGKSRGGGLTNGKWPFSV